MKTEFLKELGLEQAAIDKIMAENGKDIEAAKKPFAGYDDIKKQLGEANTTIEGFKKLDIEGIKKAADDWKLKAETAEKDAAAKIADMQFDGLLTGAITGAKGRSKGSILGELGEEKLKELRSSKNQKEDIKTALEALKKDSGYLFETDQTPPPYAPGPGKDPVQTKNAPEVNAIRVAAGLKAE